MIIYFEVHHKNGEEEYEKCGIIKNIKYDVEHNLNTSGIWAYTNSPDKLGIDLWIHQTWVDYDIFLKQKDYRGIYLKDIPSYNYIMKAYKMISREQKLKRILNV
jgi:hypothetical protein